MDYNIVLSQMMKFAIMIFIGIICVKRNVLNEEQLNTVSRLIVRVILPIFIFSNTITGATRELLIGYVNLMPIFIGVYIGWILLGIILAFVLRLKGNRKKIYKGLFTFGNVGFLGIPLIIALYPERGMVYVALFTIIDQLLLWTYGVALTSPESIGFNLKNLKKMLNPALISITLSIIIVLSGLQLPALLVDTLKTVGSASTPLSLIYIGGSLCFCDLKAILTKFEVYVGVLGKMILLPLAVFMITNTFFGSNQELVMIATILTALPSMTTIPMLARTNNMEGDYAVSVAMFTHIFAIFTLPIVSLLISKL